MPEEGRGNKPRLGITQLKFIANKGQKRYRERRQQMVGKMCQDKEADTTLAQASFNHRPVYILEKGLDIPGPVQAIVNHEGMLPDIHYQNGQAAGRMI